MKARKLSDFEIMDNWLDANKIHNSRHEDFIGVPVDIFKFFLGNAEVHAYITDSGVCNVTISEEGEQDTLTTPKGNTPSMKTIITILNKYKNQEGKNES